MSGAGSDRNGISLKALVQTRPWRFRDVVENSNQQIQVQILTALQISNRQGFGRLEEKRLQGRRRKCVRERAVPTPHLHLGTRPLSSLTAAMRKLMRSGQSYEKLRRRIDRERDATLAEKVRLRLCKSVIIVASFEVVVAMLPATLLPMGNSANEKIFALSFLNNQPPRKDELEHRARQQRKRFCWILIETHRWAHFVLGDKVFGESKCSLARVGKGPVLCCAVIENTCKAI